MIYVALGGFFGAIARYGLSQFIRTTFNTTYPFATFFINCFGSFFIGIAVGQGFSTSVQLFAVIGFLGAFTTFSTFSFEVIQLVEKKQAKMAFLYLLSSILIGIIMAFIGFQISQ
ncbi:fluoride efflux transporter CrcB [Solibacillus sp. R5-41]|uniref:fluoride efflux transporter CrcB n=1 Tax=Solibacillus sp. R5-41 TaxID=2048654 RepID=UPI000C126367|nr:fluoride efflux transporter CrcB [Solibacillus sp. R5-41]ATP41137.1 fluoride efflux transporter CrcB [Solibacillus sp. R5-41]